MENNVARIDHRSFERQCHQGRARFKLKQEGKAKCVREEAKDRGNSTCD